MRFFVKVFFLVATIFQFSCSSSSESLEKLFKNRKELSLDEMQFIEKHLGAPESFAVKDSLLMVYEPLKDTLLTIFDLKNTSKIKEVLPKGQGVGEGITLQNLSFDEDKPLFYCNDLGNNKIHVFSTYPTISLSEQKEIDPRVSTFVKYGDNWIFSIAGASKPFKTEVANEQIFWGETAKISNDLENEAINQILQGPITLTKTHKKFAWFSVYGEIYQIYDISKSPPTLIKEAIIKPPIFNNEGVQNMFSTFGVNSVTSSEQFIYALYCGKTFKDAMASPETIFDSTKILVFDWDGKPVLLLDLSNEVKSISYDKGILYALGLNSEKSYTIFMVKDIDNLVKNSF